jgi:hypothetical protein
MDAAAKVALRTCGAYLREHPGELDLVRVVVVKESDADVWAEGIGSLLPADED